MVRWQNVKFERDASADATRVKQPGKAAAPKATYKMGSTADRYGALLENMPPLKHHRDPAQSQVVAYICQQVAILDGECPTEEGRRIYYCLANMKRKCPILFDAATRLWRGRSHHE